MFDWKFYINYYKELNLKTEDEALVHWGKIGKKEGRLGCNMDKTVDSINLLESNDLLQTFNLSQCIKPKIKRNKNNLTDEIYFRDILQFVDIYNTNIDKVTTDPKMEFRYFCYRYLDYMRNVTLPNIILNQKYEAVLIEYRMFPHLEFLIRNMISKLGCDWSHTVVCGNLNYEYMLSICMSISPNIHVIRTDYDNLNQSTYSKFMASVEFWNMFHGEKILIYQEDSIILKDNINDFICWDYIGAPWPKHQNDNMNCVGNGGFSLRTKQCMLDVINTVSIENTIYNSSTLEYMKYGNMTIGPEDVYFSLNMIRYKLGKVADYESASLFSSESIYNKDSLGGHNFWLSNKMWKQSLYDNVITITYDNFDWIKYLDDNKDLIHANLKTKDKAWDHWNNHGKYEGRNASNIINNNSTNSNCHNTVYIISNNKGGGSVKYLDDIVNKYQNKNFVYINYNHKLHHYNYSSMSILFLQHLFFTNINLKDVIEIKNKYNCKLIISIHDCYWLNNKVLHDFDDTTSWHNTYLDDNINIHEDIKMVFSIADDIIHPSQFTWNMHSKYFSTHNFKLVYHNDYKCEHSKNIPKIKDCINIGVLHEYSVYKGKEYIEKLKSKYTMYKNYKINFLIVNKNIPRYKESEFYDYIDKYNIHCLTFLNKWGETYCYSLTKALNVGLPIIYNNFGAFKERIPNSDHYFKVYDNENDSDINKLYNTFESMMDYIITNNNMYSDKAINTKIIYNKYYDDLFNNKDVCFITSKIIVSKESFTYTNNRSIYSTEDRFNQTIDTINSIRKYIPSAYIILFDNSKLEKIQYNKLNNIVDLFINITDNKELNYYTNISPTKAYGDFMQTKYFLDNIKNININNLFKISGRYLLNNSFNYNNYDNDDNIFKRNDNVKDREYYYTSFYKISKKNLNNYIDSINNLYDEIINDNETYKNIDYEVLLPLKLNYDFTNVDILGVTQNLAVWKQKDDI